jgi:hypothetical protein
MANVNNPFGFRPLMSCISGAPCRIAEYGKPSTDTQVMSLWDLVQAVEADVAIPGGSPLATGVPGVQSYYQGTPGTTPILGSTLNFSPASTLGLIYVIDSIDALFAAQVIGTTDMTASLAHKLAPVVITTAGSTVTHISGMYLGTPATTDTDDMRITKLLNVPPNAEGDYAIVECIINRHQFGQGVVGV